MITFQEPLYFLLLLLIPIVFILRQIGIRHAIVLSLPLGHWNGTLPEKHTVLYAVHIFSRMIMSISFIAAVTALAAPARLTETPIYTGTGQALMFVIDLSPSMAAMDMGNRTRLQAAKDTIRTFIEAYTGDSYGLTVLGSTAAVPIPPTIDKNAFLTRLDSLRIGELGDGTAIGMGLATAVLHLDRYTDNPSHIILFTDGGNNTGDIHPKTAAHIIRHKKIAFYVAGIGKSGYAPIKYTDPMHNKEIEGTLNTVFDEKKLKDLARYGNGQYFSAQSPELLDSIFKTLTTCIPATPPAVTEHTVLSIDNIFAAAALFCAALSWILRHILLKAVII